MPVVCEDIIVLSVGATFAPNRWPSLKKKIIKIKIGCYLVIPGALFLLSLLM